jgi:hypothetical protein
VRLYVDLKLERDGQDVPVQATFWYDNGEMDIRHVLNQFGGAETLTPAEEEKAHDKAWESLPAEVEAQRDECLAMQEDAEWERGLS